VKLCGEEMMDETSQYKKKFYGKRQTETEIIKQRRDGDNALYAFKDTNLFGVPQGGTTSPLLSILVLNSQTVGKIAKWIGYADDIIFYDIKKEPKENELMKLLGIKIN
jgi:retron-type reverse transcriptase